MWLVVGALALSPVQRIEGQWSNVVCQGGTYAYGEYKASDSTMHFVDMIWNSQLGDWIILESGTHKEGAWGTPGTHGLHIHESVMDHYWETLDEDDQEDGDWDDFWDFHWEHGYGRAQDLYTNQCGWFEY